MNRLWVLFRSALVGLVATVSDLGTLVLLIHVAGLSKRAANVPSLVPGLAVQFVGNKFFAFEDRRKADRGHRLWLERTLVRLTGKLDSSA